MRSSPLLTSWPAGQRWPGEGIVGVGGEVAEHHIASPGGHSCSGSCRQPRRSAPWPPRLLLLPWPQVVEEAQGPRLWSAPHTGRHRDDPHGAVGSRLLAGAVLVGGRPGTGAARPLAGLVPGLLEVVGGLGRVPVGVGNEGVGRIPVVKVLAARPALPACPAGPDTATEPWRCRIDR